MAKAVTNYKKESENQPAFVFGKINYALMLAGIAVIGCGYVLMIGGHPENPG